MRGTSAIAPEIGPRRSLATTRQQTKSVLALGPRARLALWLLVVFLEISSVVLLALWAAIYFCHNVRRSLLWVIKVYFLFSEAYHFVDTFAFYIAGAYAALSLVFLHSVVRLLCVTIRHRELRFGLSVSRVRESDARTASSFYRASRWIVRWVRTVQYQFGVHGPYFEIRLLVDEIIELVFQTLAARASSHSISNLALNQTYGAVILLNSVSTVVFQRVFHARDDLVKQRVARLLTDLVLDFVWGTLLPVWMYQPIVKTYYKQRDHGDSIDFTENSAREVERVLVLSWWSFVLSVAPFCNSLLNLTEVRTLLREEFNDRPHVPGLSGSKIVVTFEANVPQSSSGVPFHRFTRALQALVACTGVAICITSIAASDVFRPHRGDATYGCVHRVYPWFTKKEACVGRTFDCEVFGIDGSYDQVDAALQLFDTTTLADLFISNCPALNLSTPTLHAFRHLQSLVIVNASIVGWHRDVSALSYDAMPELRTVKLERVTFDAPLDTIALLTTPLSRSTEWVYISETNMSEALGRDDLVADNWEHLIYFDCAGCALTAFPQRVMASMGQLIMLSLVENDVRDFPSDWPAPTMSIVMVWFDGNTQLRELSDALWRQALGPLQSVYIQNTSLTHVPSWLDDTATLNVVFEVYASGAPLCASTDGSNGLPAFVSCEVQAL